MDTCLEEEASVEASVAIFVDRAGRVCGSRKEGEGLVLAKHLGGMARCASAMAKGVFNVLNAAVEKASSARVGDKADGMGPASLSSSGAGFL